uniref:Uncharacterized protein n=1 Tax=Sphaerodactylus townsendi TaxID=933632 RepID=A0ACB8GD68_9SAUR
MNAQPQLASYHGKRNPSGRLQQAEDSREGASENSTLDYNDEIRQEQLRELSYLNGSEDSTRGRGLRGRGIRVPPAAPSRWQNKSPIMCDRFDNLMYRALIEIHMIAMFILRGRGGAVPPPPPGRGAQAPRGTPVTRGVLSVAPVARGIPTPRARGVPAVPGYRPPPPPAHEAYEEYVST